MSRNIVLFVLDSVRRDISLEEMTTLYNDADLTTQCRAGSSWSVPAHGSILTGELPHEHGVHADNFDYTTIQETFLDDIYHRTIGVSANSYASSTFGFDTHFDRFTDIRPNRYFSDALDVNDWLGSDNSLLREIINNERPVRSCANVGYLGVKHLTQRLPIPALIDEGMKPQLKALRREVSEEPFFIFANIMEAHRPMFQHIGLDKKYAPYRWTSRSVGKWEINLASEPNVTYGSYLRTYRDLYRGALRYMDRHVSGFISDIVELTENETTVIVTSDHGEGLALPGDGGIIDHTGIFTDSVLNVPLLIFNPPEDVDIEWMSHLDLPELMLGLADDEAPVVDRDWAPSEVIGAMGTPDENESWWDRTCRSLWNPDDVYSWDSISSNAPPEVANQYFSTPIDAFRTRTDHSFDDSTQRRLEDLGYL